MSLTQSNFFRPNLRLEYDIEKHWPIYQSRLKISQMLIELQDFHNALKVLDTLIMENDDDYETYYLSGYCFWKLSSNTQQEGLTTQERIELLKDGKESLENVLIVYLFELNVRLMKK